MDKEPTNKEKILEDLEKQTEDSAKKSKENWDKLREDARKYLEKDSSKDRIELVDLIRKARKGKGSKA